MAKLLSPGQNQATPAKDVRQLAEMQEQKQAETLLELAVAQKAGATEQISSHVDRWQGKLTWNSRMANLTAAALDSNDMRVREAGVEVELAAYGLAKNSASFQYVLQMMESDKHAEKMWALWALGLMGNRGVQQDQVIELLISHLKDSEEDSRRWAVEALALVGTDSTIEPLLRTMHDDPSPLVRERAACSLAQSGMLTPEQRMSAVPQLLTYTDDASLDAPTHQWAFHALNDITHQHLPNDSAAWRRWYESTRQ
jgi:HEAT repeat protein